MKERHWVVTLAAIGTLCGLAKGAGQVRCAVMASREGGLSLSPLVSLLEARLSQSNDIQLLERAAIDKVLQEQHLSVAGLVERETAVKVGKLLRADAFVHLSRENLDDKVMLNPSSPDQDKAESTKGQIIRVRAVETVHGLRLLDYFEPLDDGNLEEVTARIAKKIEGVAAKLNLPDGQLIPVGIVDIHRTEMGERHKLLERALPMLLSARLSKERQIIVLEREDLKHLLDEKRLTEGEDAKFWGSTVLIDGDLRLRDGVLEMRIRLYRSGGDEILSLTLPVEPNAPSTAVDQIAVELAKQAKEMPPTTPWQPGLEAEEFYRQGQLLYKNQRYRDAVGPLETAYALQPTHVFYTGALFLNEWYARYDRSSRVYKETGQSFYSDLELSEIVSTLVRQIRDAYEAGQLGSKDVTETWGEPLGLDYKQLNYFGSSVSIATDAIRAVNQENRAIWVNTVRTTIKDAYDPTKPIELAWTSSDSPEEVVANLKNAFAELARRQAAATDPQEANTLYCYWRTWLLSGYGHWRVRLLFPPSPTSPGLEKTQLRDSEDRFRELWQQYLLELTEDPYPLARFLGCLAVCDWFSRPEHRDQKKSDLYRHQAIENAMDEILKGEQVSRSLRMNVVRDIKGKPYVTVAEFEAMLESLIANKDLRGLATWNPGDPPRFSRESMGLPEEWWNRYNRLLTATNTLLQSQEQDADTSLALVSIKNFQSKWRIIALRPEPAPTSRREGVTMLLKREVGPPPISFSKDGVKVERQGNRLWIASLYRWLRRTTPDGPTTAELSVSLIGVDTEKKDLIAAWRAVFPFPYPAATNVRISGVTAGSRASYVSLTGMGLMEFPGCLTRGKDLSYRPRVYGQEDGLPSVLITAIASQGEGRLLVAYGDKGQESGLGIYEPNTGRWESVFCSSLKGEPPFNGDHPYRIYSLMHAPINIVYLFVVDPGDYWRTGKSRNCDGLWKLDVGTHRTTYLGPFSEIPHWLDTEEAEGTLRLKTTSLFMEFDIQSETMRFLAGNPSHIVELRSEKKVPLCKFEHRPFVPDASKKEILFYAQDRFDLISAAIHGDQLWARFGMSQIAILKRGRPFEETEIIPNDILDGEPVVRFISTPYGLVAIGNGTVGLIETGDLPEGEKERVLNQ